MMNRQMNHIGVYNEQLMFWAPQGDFAEPGLYLWNGKENVRAWPLPPNSALTDYIETCRETALYESKGTQSLEAVTYCAMGLVGEAGEIANKLKKVLRGDSPLNPSVREALLAECGDVAWYLTRLCEELGSDLASVMGDNARKLLDRQARNTLRGAGDER